MPIRSWIEAERRLIRAEVTGTFTMQDILDTIRTAVCSPEFGPGFDILSAHTGLDTPIGTSQVEATAAYLHGLADEFGGSRWAVVTDSDSSAGMMRVLSAWLEQVPIDLRAFRSMDDALVWLGRAEAEPNA